MKYGVTTYLWSGDFTPATLSILPSIKEAGFDGVELPIFRAAGFDAAAIRRGLEANVLEVIASCVLVDGDIGLAEAYMELSRKSVEAFENAKMRGRFLEDLQEENQRLEKELAAREAEIEELQAPPERKRGFLR